jgi:hypothetical protein
VVDPIASRSRPDHITESDLVAVSMLGTPIDPLDAAWILYDGADQICELVVEIPAEVDLWRADESTLADDAPLGRLLDLLLGERGLHPTGPSGIGPSGAGKLIAAKRPHLVPISDDHVEVLLPPPSGFVHALRTALSTPEQRLAIVIAVTPIGGVRPDGLELSMLRPLDIALRMSPSVRNRPTRKAPHGEAGHRPSATATAHLPVAPPRTATTVDSA